MKKILIILGILLILGLLGIFILARVFYPDNIAETSIDGGSKGLKTRMYEQDTKKVVNVIKEVLSTMSTYGSSWKIVSETEETHSSTATFAVEIPVVVFIDDMEIQIGKSENGKTKVDVKSKSRVGQSDFGENARHIRKLLNALDKRLAE